MQSNSFLEGLQNPVTGQKGNKYFMSNGFQLILTPIMCFEVRLECEMCCQNVNFDDKNLKNLIVKLVCRFGVYLDPIM